MQSDFVANHADGVHDQKVIYHLTTKPKANCIILGKNNGPKPKPQNIKVLTTNHLSENLQDLSELLRPVTLFSHCRK